MGKRIMWSKEEKEYLKEITPGHHYAEIVELMNKKFDREFTVELVKNAISRYKLNTGFNGRFKKGIVPYNKGQKGVWNKGSEKSWFKKGKAPTNHRPVGSESVDTKDGYLSVKVAEPNKWELKHKVIWEKANGKMPEGYCVIFADQNKRNFNLDNLVLVSKAELLIMNKEKLIKKDANLTKVGVNIAKVKAKVNEIKKDLKVGG